MNRFERVDNIFETEEPFRENYNPERLYNREDELDEYASALMPVVKGDLPKTSCIREPRDWENSCHEPHPR